MSGRGHPPSRRPLGMAGRLGRGMCWGKRGRGCRGCRGGGTGTLLALALLAAVGFLAWRHGPPAHRAARRAPPPPSPADAELLRKPVYAKPALDPGALGELGRAVRLELSPAEKRLQEDSIRRHQINIYLSDRISLHRRLPERWNPL